MALTRGESIRILKPKVLASILCLEYAMQLLYSKMHRLIEVCPQTLCGKTVIQYSLRFFLVFFLHDKDSIRCLVLDVVSS